MKMFEDIFEPQIDESEIYPDIDEWLENDEISSEEEAFLRGWVSDDMA